MSKPTETAKNVASKIHSIVGTKALIVTGTIAGFIIAGVALNAARGPETVVIVNEAPLDPETPEPTA